MTEPAVVATLHFVVGCAAVVMGFAALIWPKGRGTHRATGAIYLVAMTMLTASGLWMSLSRGILFTVFLSAMAFHVFLSGWGAAAFRTRAGRAITAGSPYLSAAIAVGALAGAVAATSAPGGVINDLPPAAFLVITAVAGLACAGDIGFSRTGLPGERQRITRHGWRMGFSLFLATGIFFFGNNHVLPDALRQPMILSAPVLAVAVLTLFFSVRSRLFGARRHSDVSR